MSDNRIEFIATFPIYKPFRRINEDFRKSIQNALLSINNSQVTILLSKFKVMSPVFPPTVEELNQFLFSGVSTTREDLLSIPNRILIEDKIDRIYTKFRKKTLKNLRKIYSKDPEFRNSLVALEQINTKLNLGLDNELDKISTLPELVIREIEKIYLNGSLLIWDMPGSEIDRIIAGYEKINREGDSLEELDIGIISDELVLATFGKEHVPVLESQINGIVGSIQQLNKEIKNYTSLLNIVPDEETLVLLFEVGSVFLGKLLGSREPFFLAEKQLKRYISLEKEIVEEGNKMGSDFLSGIYEKFINKHTIFDVLKQLETIQEIISLNVEPLRKLLISIENATIDSQTSNTSITDFVKFTSTMYFNLEEFRFITETFQDIPSFTSMGGGIAVESSSEQGYEIPNDTIIYSKDVFRTFPLVNSTVYAIRGVDLDIKQGEFVAIMGPSGSGKTTLLNILSGLDKPDRGIVNVTGLDLGTAREKDLINFRKNHVSFIYQSYNLLPNLTNEENVRLPADLGTSKNIPNKKERARELLESVGLKQFIKGRPLVLSGGQQQRVTIARALMNFPDILFADEPTGDLDGTTGEQIMDIISAFHKDGVTIVMVTHDEKIAARADRIIKMFDGKVVE